MVVLEKRNPEIAVELHILKKKNWNANIYDPDGTRNGLVDEN